MPIVDIDVDMQGRVWCRYTRKPFPDDPDAALQYLGDVLRLHAWRPRPPLTPQQRREIEGKKTFREPLMRFSHDDDSVGWIADGYPPLRAARLNPALVDQVVHSLGVGPLLEEILRAGDPLTARRLVWSSSSAVGKLPSLATAFIEPITFGLPLEEACPPIALTTAGIPALHARLYAAAGVSPDEARETEAAGAYDANALRTLAALRRSPVM